MFHLTFYDSIVSQMNRLYKHLFDCFLQKQFAIVIEAKYITNIYKNPKVLFVV